MGIADLVVCSCCIIGCVYVGVFLINYLLLPEDATTTAKVIALAARQGAAFSLACGLLCSRLAMRELIQLKNQKAVTRFRLKIAVALLMLLPLAIHFAPFVAVATLLEGFIRALLSAAVLFAGFALDEPRPSFGNVLDQDYLHGFFGALAANAITWYPALIFGFFGYREGGLIFIFLRVLIALEGVLTRSLGLKKWAGWGELSGSHQAKKELSAVLLQLKQLFWLPMMLLLMGGLIFFFLSELTYAHDWTIILGFLIALGVLARSPVKIMSSSMVALLGQRALMWLELAKLLMIMWFLICLPVFGLNLNTVLVMTVSLGLLSEITACQWLSRRLVLR